MNSNGTSYQNGLFVNVDEVHNNTKNMTLSGFNQEGGTVTGNIENLTIESKQNTSTTKGRTVGGSLSIAPNGMPSGSANYSQTNGERRVVDNASTFIIGDGSNLKVGKVENTASAIGTSGNGKLSIDEYVGHDLENVDKLKTVGGSVGISTSGITSLGVNYSDRKQEGITKNTVIGNVEIGKSSGDEINKDLNTMTEITEDRKFETNVNIESQTINYIKNPEKFKEDLQKAKNEIHDIYHAVDSTVNLQGKENRNILEQVGEVRQAKVIYNLIDSRLQKAENQEDIAKVFEGASEDLGYKVKVIYTDPSNSPQLIGVDKNGNKYIKDGTAYVDKKTGIGYILVNTESPANSTKAGVIGTIAEEQSHVIGKFEGRQKTVPDGSEKGLESLGKPTNDYFKKQYSKNDKAIDLKSDGKDYSNVDFGENVGDKKIKDPRDFLKNEYGTEKEKKELEDLFSKEKGEKVYIDWDLYEGNFSEAMHYSLYERLKNQISKYSYRYKINYWGFEAKTRVNDTNEINKDFKEIDNSEAVYHNYIPEINSINMEKNKINTKRVNYYTGQESVTDFNGKLVTDTWNIGTGNTFTYDPNKKNWANTRDKIYHGLVDIPNWVFLGTGIADKSTTWQRLRLFIMGAKVSGNYEELTDKGYNTVGEKELKDFYNRKQAEIEERKIKNTNLR
ncbi:hypothetical protein RN92_06605 [Fusobacterium hwasookii ChDC F206]|uniref:Hemolysin n=2 Tax=Fusobacterium TaxID=848 RepID=A0AAC8WJZ4_9FUSO|nr:hypothetical protein RN92_06605 [Fusobacterium hwasookii ChDC F206]